MRRTLVAALGVAAAVVLFFVFRPGDDEPAADDALTAVETVETVPTTTAATTTAPTTTRRRPPSPVVVNIDATREAIARPKVKRGRQLVIRVTADVTDHVHLHGYDLMRDVAPGRPAEIAFRATITGVFEIELEDADRRIAELEVSP